jgi:hypothetical protein
MKKFAIGCLAVAAMVVLGVIGLWGFVRFQKAKHDKTAIPFIESYLIQLAHWEPERVQQYWAPEVAAALNSEQTKRLFAMYSKLGELQSFEPVAFRQVGANTKVPYREVVTYQVSAKFAAGPANITLQLVRPRSGEIRVWYLHINSLAFLPEVTGGESPKSRVPPP